MTYDCIIVGASLAGLMAARELINTTSNFIIIDSKKEIGEPLRCAEGINANGYYELFGKTPQSFLKNHTSKLVFNTKGTTKTTPKDFIILDRPKFEKWLSKPIKSTNLRLNTRCNDIIKKSTHMEVITNKTTLKAKSVILAYGPNYSIQKKFNLIKENPLLIPCYGGIFKYKNLTQDSLHFYYDSKEHVALWIFPKDDKTANAGVGQFPKVGKNNLKASIKKLTKEYKITLTGKPTFAGSYPSSGPIKKTYMDRMLVAGDAAGQVYAGIGEGIYFSLKAGQLAGQTIKDAIKTDNFNESSLKIYEKRWKKAIGNHMKAGIIFTELLLFGLRYNLAGGALRHVRKDEVTSIYDKGKVPFRIMLGYIILKYTGTLNSKSKRLPLVFRLMIKLLLKKKKL